MASPRALFSLEGSVALVTGAAHGLGATIADGLAQAGAAVALADLDLAWAEQRAAALRAHDHQAIAVEMDVSRPDSIARALTVIERDLGTVDVLINNAGLKTSALRPPRDAADLDAEEWQRMLDVNLTGVFHCCQAVFKGMLTRGGGSVVNLASIYGLVASRAGPAAPYSVTKAGVIGLTRALAVEWAPHHIRVNALAPTHITPRDDEPIRPTAAPEHEQAIHARTPMARRGGQHELVGPVVFLASDASSLVTGHVLAVDGGWLAW